MNRTYVLVLILLLASGLLEISRQGRKTKHLPEAAVEARSITKQALPEPPMSKEVEEVLLKDDWEPKIPSESLPGADSRSSLGQVLEILNPNCTGAAAASADDTGQALVAPH